MEEETPHVDPTEEDDEPDEVTEQGRDARKAILERLNKSTSPSFEELTGRSKEEVRKDTDNKVLDVTGDLVEDLKKSTG